VECSSCLQNFMLDQLLHKGKGFKTLNFQIFLSNFDSEAQVSARYKVIRSANPTHTLASKSSHRHLSPTSAGGILAPHQTPPTWQLGGWQK
jgi:hypothetical protein